MSSTATSPDPADDPAELRSEILRLSRRLERARSSLQESETIAEVALSRFYEADQLKSQFIAGISHELRTPLTAVLGFAQLLVDHDDRIDADTRHVYLDRLLRNATELSDLIEDVLAFTRIDRDPVDTSPDPVDLGDAVGRILGDLVPVVGGREIRTDLVPHLMARIHEDSLQRMVSNLVVNAHRYSPADAPIEVMLTAEDGPTAVFEVLDQGPGVPPAERELVFEPFYRGTGDLVIRSHGTGLGLTVVRHLAELQGGSVTIADNQPRGARISVRLPLDVESGSVGDPFDD